MGKQQDHGSFGDLTSINRRKTLKEDMPGKKSFSTLVQLNENGKSSVQTNQELVMVHANGEVTLDLIGSHRISHFKKILKRTDGHVWACVQYCKEKSIDFG